MQQNLMKTDGKFVRIGDLLYVRNGRLYGMKRLDGKLVRKVAPLQGLDAVDGRGRPTVAAKRWVRQWADQLESEGYFAAKSAKKEPTWGELMTAYELHARVEFELNGSPRPGTVEMNLSEMRYVLREVGLTVDDKVSKLSRNMMEVLIQEMVARGLSPRSVCARFSHVRSLFAKWALDYYRRRNDWDVAVPDIPTLRAKNNLDLIYQRPPASLRERTMEWYKELEVSQPKVWLAATLMLQFGMRNGDACRVKWDNIQREGELYVLGYIPSKTSTSSGRRVHVPFDSDLYARMRRAGDGEDLILGGDGLALYMSINAQMRALGWGKDDYSKASYELRKLCIDRIYREFGAEAATQVSGDDIKTVCRYYADPSRAFSVAFNL